MINELKNKFTELGIEKGNTIFVSSDVTLLLYDSLRRKQKITLDDIINILQDIIGHNGNLIFPTYNWDFCKGKTFDYRKTISKTGSLTQKALDRKDFKRTKHPIYSFAVWGKDQDYLTSLDYKDSFGADSIFGWFEKVQAKNLIINVSYQHSATFVHFLEERNKVNYRFIKDFTAKYTDENGNTSIQTYSMFVRYLDKEVITTIDPMQEVFVKNGAVKETMLVNSYLRLLDMEKAYELVEYNIKYENSDKLVIIKELEATKQIGENL